MLLGELGQRIRTQRERLGLKQHDIANALQVSPQAVSKWERGENAPDIAVLGELCTLLGVTTDWLLGRGLDQGFTCARVDGHGSDHERFSIAEQVRGRQHRVEFRVLLDEAERDDLLESLAAEFFGADLFYFMTPVLQMA